MDEVKPNTPRSLILCSGTSTDEFLDGLLSCTLPEPDQARYGFLLNRAGRIVHECFVYGYDRAHYLLDCASEEAVDLINTLNRFSSGHTVEFALAEQLILSTHPEPGEHLWEFIDPRAAAMGWRSVAENPRQAISDSSYHQRRIALALPEGPLDLPREAALPLEYGFHDINAIALDKGCYIGQEVCSRMYHLGQPKHTVVALKAPGTVLAGETVLDDQGKPCGSILSCLPDGANGCFAFARLKHPVPAALSCGSLGLSLCQQPWRRPDTLSR